MLKHFYSVVIRYPKVTIALILGVTVYLAMQLPLLRWETDARVYLPKGHAAIKYDEKVDEVFGVKDSVIVGIVNEQKGIFNPVTLARIARITEKVAALPGVISLRSVDVASLSTAQRFVGTDTSMGSELIMPVVPNDAESIARLKKTVYDNSDLFVGNIVSADGTAAMIRAKLKEGITGRYQTYFAIKGILAGEGAGWGEDGDGNWGAGGQQGWKDAGGKWPAGGQQGWQQSGQGSAGRAQGVMDNGDKIYLAGRPVIEVTSGLHAITDMKIMIPSLLVVLFVILFLVYRTVRGVILPIFVMSAAIVWTMGIMAMLGWPLYTISTMMPVILLAVGIGDAVHLISHYNDDVLHHPHRPGPEIVAEAMKKMGLAVVMTSATTAIGFMTLLSSEMPPFKVFGAFTALGIIISCLLTLTFIPAALSLMKPKVSGYLGRRLSLRLYASQDRLTRILVAAGRGLLVWHKAAYIALGLIVIVALVGTSKLFVDSSWMSDFRQNSDLVQSNNMLNQKFAGTIFLNIVVEGASRDALKSPAVLRKIEGLQHYVDGLSYVGRSLSIVDYLKNMNKALHSGDVAFNVLPDSQKQIGEDLFLFSVSGHPEQLDEMIDYDYQTALVTVWIKTDHTAALRNIIEKTRAYIDREFKGTNVQLNFAGSANNSKIWADLLIDNQISNIWQTKLTIFLLAALLFRSIVAGLYTILPVTLTTLLVGGAAGYLGIPIDVSTALAAGMAIGAGVDYSVHYIFRYRDEWRASGNREEATVATLRSVGRTIVLNAIVVISGFVILIFSQFPPHAKLGYFVAAYMVVSCLCALIVLPLLFVWHQPKGYLNRVESEKSEVATGTVA